MKKDVLEFLKKERDLLAKELRLLMQGERRVVYLSDTLQDITTQVIADAEARLLRFEEWIAASESGVA